MGFALGLGAIALAGIVWLVDWGWGAQPPMPNAEDVTKDIW